MNAETKARSRHESRHLWDESQTFPPPLSASKSRWSPNTFATYRQIADSHIRPGIGARNVHELIGANIQE
jgi:hypothetical protein